MFDYLKYISYNDIKTSNIMTRANIVKTVLSRYEVFYDYVVEDGERPDTIAYDYYGDSKYDWLVKAVNNITNIYRDWPKTNDAMLQFLKDNYGNINDTMSQIDHYSYVGENASRITNTMSIKTFTELQGFERIGWVPIYIYDYEFDENDKKRHIRLLSNEYIKQIDKELSEIFNE